MREDALEPFVFFLSPFSPVAFSPSSSVRRVYGVWREGGGGKVLFFSGVVVGFY
jgi:hypothetical protein